MALPKEMVAILEDIQWPDYNITTLRQKERKRLVEKFGKICKKNIDYKTKDVRSWVDSNAIGWSEPTKNYVVNAAEVVQYAYDELTK